MGDFLIYGALVVMIIGMAAVFVIGCNGDRDQDIGVVDDFYHRMAPESETVVSTESHKVTIDGYHVFKLGSRCFLRRNSAPNSPEYTLLLVPAPGQAFMVRGVEVR